MPFGSKRFLHEHTMPIVARGSGGRGPRHRRPRRAARHIRGRVAGIADTVFLYQPGPMNLETLAAIIDELG